MAELFTQKTEVGRGGGETGASTLETFKIQIGISKINNFTFKCYIFLSKIF
jgi:hypothetical protein